MLGAPTRSRARIRSIIVALAVAGATLSIPTLLSAPAEADPCGPQGNEIACENSKPGSPRSEWEIDGSGDQSIQGFSTDISVDAGQRIDFKIDTDASAYTLTIYRTGYYGGDGARKIATINPSVALPQTQPQCLTDISTELYDCGNWSVSAYWNVPATAVSGIYIARLHRADRNDTSHITFIVRDDSSQSDIVFQTSDTTWQAYNTYGGSDFYRGGANRRAYKLSYNRPVTTRSNTPWGRDFYFANEYPMVRFLERNGYDVSYIAGVDTHRRGNLLTNHKVFLSVGHDEYWSGRQRDNVQAARDAGVNLMFLSGNEMYWRTRYEPSADPTSTPYRTLVSYKETWANAKIDPADEWTGTWRDPRFAPKSQGAGLWENQLTGTAYVANYSDLPVTVSASEGKTRLWRGTSLATMPAGGSQELTPHTVGYESNEDLDNGARPPGLIRLSTTTGSVEEYLQDYGNTVAPGVTSHHVTLYRAPSGALVFSAGSVQWTWGLDSEHDSFDATPADPRMQQAQVNLFADMGVQPRTLMAGLNTATKSTDSTAPTASISSPPAGANQSNGTSVTVTGTASDSGGGVVAGVEVSTDGGSTWHAASGTSNWSYTFVQHGTGSTPLLARAIDDSANIGPTTSRSFSVSCPCSVFGGEVPADKASTDTSAAELGLRFTPVADGFVNGVRFYKGLGNTGTHVGSLWNSGGQQLAQVTFTNESASGWQSASFASPVPVIAGQTYVISYTAPEGRYAYETWAFSAERIESGPLQVDGGYGALPSGVYSWPGTFPASSYRNTNYFVDVLFTSTDESPLIAMNQWPTPNSGSASMTTSVSAKFSKNLAPGTAGLVLKDPLGSTVAGNTAYDATSRVVTFTPSAPLDGLVKYTATVSGTDTLGNPVTTGRSWSFTTGRPPNSPGVCPCTLFDDTTTPTQLEDAYDKVPVTLGVRFSSDASGIITGVRFYKGPNNVGTHTGALWAADGTLLAEGTFADESTSGWQEMSFASPVTIRKNATYVASYHAPVGRYSATPNAFASTDLSRPPLRVTSYAGAYTYGSGFPGNSSPSSYLVDVVFEKRPPSLVITDQDPAPGAVGVPRKSDVRVWLSDSVAPGSEMQVRAGSTVLAGTTSLDSTGTRITWTPASALPADSLLTVSLTGATSLEGASLGNHSWTFRTRGPDPTTAQTMFGDEIPRVYAASEGAPVELGTAFTPARDGKITAVRFFKGEGNLGAHTGSLWSTSGTRLATVTFTNETARGWQTATLPSPVNVTAGTTYVVSYHAPQGHYSYTGQFFSSAWTAGDLTAPSANNGRYLYGGGGSMPVYSWGASNYFVDVVFDRTPIPFTVTDRSPSAGGTAVLREATPSVSFSAPLASGWTFIAESDGTAIPGTVALSNDGQRLTFTPSASLPADSDVTMTADDLTSVEGLTLPPQTWSFHTAAGPGVLTSLFSDLTPANGSVNDPSAVELGTAFTPSVDGQVTHIKFWKGVGNGGTHTGSIWSSGGTRLATVTFRNETASGWQTAALATPLQLTAGASYVVSYFAPNGNYATTPGYFWSPRTLGPLTAPAGSNGRYRYGTGGGFPASSYNATNYFVDIVFRSSSANP